MLNRDPRELNEGVQLQSAIHLFFAECVKEDNLLLTNPSGPSATATVYRALYTVLEELFPELYAFGTDCSNVCVTPTRHELYRFDLDGSDTANVSWQKELITAASSGLLIFINLLRNEYGFRVQRIYGTGSVDVS